MSNPNLSNQFNSILTQYQDIYQEYIQVLNSNDNSFIVVPDTLFIGQNNIKSIPNSTVDSCLIACNSDTSISGASINITTGNCTLSSGTGNLITDKNTTSIVPKNIYYSYQLQELNAQLLSINQEIMEKAKLSQTNYQTSQQQNEEQDKMLQQNYHTLTQQREEIHRLMRSYENLDAAYEDGNINVTSNYYTYIVLLFVTILLVFLLLKFSITGKQIGGSTANNFKMEALFLFGIMVVFLVLSKILNNLHSFNFIAILLIAYLVAKIKLNH